MSTTMSLDAAAGVFRVSPDTAVTSTHVRERLLP
jgi:hypothetical protein